MIEKILVNGLGKEVNEANIEIGLEVDATTLDKFRTVINKTAPNNIQYVELQSKIALGIMTILEEVRFEAHFKSPLEFLKSSGLEQENAALKEKLAFLKDMDIKLILEEFAPEVL